MKRCVFQVLLLTTLLGTFVPHASAQQATPVAVERDEISVAAGFPAATELGPTWTLRSTGTIAPFNDTESPRYTGQYVDQSGNRAFVNVVRYGRSALDASVAYEAAEDYVDDQERQLTESDDALTNARLDRVDAPADCSDVLRVVGLDPLTFFPVGLTICVDEEGQRVISVVVSGQLDVDGQPRRYHEASDALMDLIIATLPE